jgi:hypothetical protein
MHPPLGLFAGFFFISVLRLKFTPFYVFYDCPCRAILLDNEVRLGDRLTDALEQVTNGRAKNLEYNDTQY